MSTARPTTADVRRRRLGLTVGLVGLGVVLVLALAGPGTSTVHLALLVPVLLAGLVMRSRAIWLVVAAAALLHVLVVLVAVAPGRAVGGSPVDLATGLVVLGLLGLVLDPRRSSGTTAPGPPPRAGTEGGGAPVAPNPLVEASGVEELARLVRVEGGDGSGTGLLVIELDLLAELADGHGRPAASAALEHAAAVVRGAVRPGDTVARLGPEELLVLMPGVGPAAVPPRAEALRRAVRDAPLPWEDGDLQVTVTVGAAHTGSGADGLVGLHARATTDLALARDRRRRPVDPTS